MDGGPPYFLLLMFLIGPSCNILSVAQPLFWINEVYNNFSSFNDTFIEIYDGGFGNVALSNISLELERQNKELVSVSLNDMVTDKEGFLVFSLKNADKAMRNILEKIQNETVNLKLIVTDKANQTETIDVFRKEKGWSDVISCFRNETAVNAIVLVGRNPSRGSVNDCPLSPVRLDLVMFRAPFNLTVQLISHSIKNFHLTNHVFNVFEDDTPVKMFPLEKYSTESGKVNVTLDISQTFNLNSTYSIKLEVKITSTLVVTLESLYFGAARVPAAKLSHPFKTYPDKNPAQWVSPVYLQLVPSQSLNFASCYCEVSTSTYNPFVTISDSADRTKKCHEKCNDLISMSPAVTPIMPPTYEVYKAGDSVPLSVSTAAAVSATSSSATSASPIASAVHLSDHSTSLSSTSAPATSSSALPTALGTDLSAYNSTSSSATSSPVVSVSLSKNSTSVPEGSTSVPATSPPPSANSTSVPEGSTSVPATSPPPSSNSTSVPEGSTSVPEGSTSVPEGSTSVPEGSTSVPEGSTSVPATSSPPSANSTSVPEGSTSVPEGSTSVPEGSTSVPESSTSVPEGSTSLPATSPSPETSTSSETESSPTSVSPSEIRMSDTTVPITTALVTNTVITDAKSSSHSSTGSTATIARTTESSTILASTKEKTDSPTDFWRYTVFTGNSETTSTKPATFTPTMTANTQRPRLTLYINEIAFGLHSYRENWIELKGEQSLQQVTSYALMYYKTPGEQPTTCSLNSLKTTGKDSLLYINYKTPAAALLIRNLNSKSGLLQLVYKHANKSDELIDCVAYQMEATVLSTELVKRCTLHNVKQITQREFDRSWTISRCDGQFEVLEASGNEINRCPTRTFSHQIYMKILKTSLGKNFKTHFLASFVQKLSADVGCMLSTAFFFDFSAKTSEVDINIYAILAAPNQTKLDALFMCYKTLFHQKHVELEIGSETVNVYRCYNSSFILPTTNKASVAISETKTILAIVIPLVVFFVCLIGGIILYMRHRRKSLLTVLGVAQYNADQDDLLVNMEEVGRLDTNFHNPTYSQLSVY